MPVAAEAAGAAVSVTQGIIEAAAAGAVLVVPGYVLSAVSARGGRDPDASERALTVRLASNSMMVHAVELPWTAWPAGRVLRRGPAPYGLEIYFWVLATCLAVPFLLGRASAWLGTRAEPSRAAKLAAVLGFSADARFTHAWSAHFGGRPRVSACTRVVLRDGRRIHGFFGRGSYASADSAVHDLFLHRVVRMEGARFRGPHPSSLGIWINGSDIVSVEFFRRETVPTNTESDSRMSEIEGTPQAAPPDPAEAPAAAENRVAEPTASTGTEEGVYTPEPAPGASAHGRRKQVRFRALGGDGDASDDSGSTATSEAHEPQPVELGGDA